MRAMASTRTSFRPRPLDTLKQLIIVRDIAELDSTDGLDPSQPQAVPTNEVKVVEGQQQAGPAGAHQKKKKEVKEIPVPEVRFVPGYTREYLPLFKIPDTYIKAKGGVGWAKEDFVEYDLDNEDEDWLDAYNAGHVRLPGEKLEKMLWVLETQNAEANQRVMSEPGYGTDWRMLPAYVANTSNLQKEDAIVALRKQVGGRDQMLELVYEYWKGKRERLGKPILRRLQAPTNPSDTNPFNVFRPREKVNRPQTRRRRENTNECLEKCNAIRQNQLKALEITELVVFREARKRDIIKLDVDMQIYQLSCHHQPRQHHEQLDAMAAAKLQEAQARSQHGDARLRTYLGEGGSSASTSYDQPLRRALARKRRRQDMEGNINGDAIARLPPAPLPADDELLMLLPLDLAKLLNGSSAAPAAGGSSSTSSGKGGAAGHKPPPLVLPPGVDPRCVRARIGRGGRMMLTRSDPLTLEPHSPLENGAAAAGPSARGPPLSAQTVPLNASTLQPWAASLDVSLLPEGLTDKAAILQSRERRQHKALHAQQNLQRHAQQLYQHQQSAMHLPVPSLQNARHHPPAPPAAAPGHAPIGLAPPPVLQPHVPPVPPPPPAAATQQLGPAPMAPPPAPAAPAQATPFAGMGGGAGPGGVGRKASKATAVGNPPMASRSPSPGGPMLMAKQTVSATPGPLGAAGPSGGAPPGAPPSGHGSVATTPAAVVGPGAAGGSGTKKLLSGSKASGGPGSAPDKAKRGPGRPPKANKANGETPGGTPGDGLP